MTVKELILKLSRFNGEAKVFIWILDDVQEAREIKELKYPHPAGLAVE